jgi:hypothetical protein
MQKNGLIKKASETTWKCNRDNEKKKRPANRFLFPESLLASLLADGFVLGRTPAPIPSVFPSSANTTTEFVN